MTEIIIDLNGEDKVIANNILSEIKSLYDGAVSKMIVTSQGSKLPVWVWAGEKAPEEELPEFGVKKDMMVRQRLILKEKANEQAEGNPWTCKTYFFMYMARVFKSFFEKNGKGDKYLKIMKKTISLANDADFELTPRNYHDLENEEDANWWYNFCDFYSSLKPPSQEKPNLNVLLGDIKLKTPNGVPKELKKLAPEEYDKDGKPAGPRRLAWSKSQEANVRKLDTNFIIDCYKEFTPFKLVEAADAATGADAAAAGAAPGEADEAAGAGGKGGRRRRKRRKSRKKKSKKSKRKSKKRKTKKKRKKRKSRKRRR